MVNLILLYIDKVGKKAVNTKKPQYKEKQY